MSNKSTLTVSLLLSSLALFVPFDGAAQPARPSTAASAAALPADLAKLPKSCQTGLIADVVAIDHPIVFNRLGAQNVNWMMYALRHDVIDLKSKRTLDYTPEGEARFQQVVSTNASREIALRPDLRPRPLVLRVAAGGYLVVRFTNLLELKPVGAPTPDDPFPTPGNPFNSHDDPLPGVDHPMEHAVKDTPGERDADGRLIKPFHIDDQVASRSVGFHPQGLHLVGTIDSDSSFVGSNADSLAKPGKTHTYCFHAPHEGAFLVSSAGAAFGGEGTAGNSGVGLFGAITVQPSGARFYRAQVTEEEMRRATRASTLARQPVINYEAVYPNQAPWIDEGKAGMPILNMVMNGRIVHGDINAIIVGPTKNGSFPRSTYPLEKAQSRNPTLPNRLEPFREFVSIYHDENAATQAFPYFFEHPELSHTLHGVRDAFMINYGSGGIGAEIIANRLKTGPMQDCVDCAYEEFFLSSFAVGDAAMLVDRPANLITGRCQPEFVEAATLRKAGQPHDTAHATAFDNLCVQHAKARATHAYYPHDPANVHHSYIGDFVKFRNLHAGKEQHIFHLHNHQWLFNPNDDNSNYIDAQGIGPGSGYSYEIAFGGSGNRNKTVGDAIFHCHFYPHFAQGMWYLWRIHDVMESGTRLAISGNKFHTEPFALMNGQPAKGARALPDGEIVSGTPIPAVVPLPGKALPPMPEAVTVAPKANGMGSKAVLAQPISKRTKNPGYPFWVAGVTEHGKFQAAIGSRPTTPPLDMDPAAGGFDGGLPRHALDGYSAGGEDKAELSRLSAKKEIVKAKPVYFPENGTDLERIAMRFHATRHHWSFRFNLAGNVLPARFVVNGAKPVPGAPYNDPCIDDTGKPLKTGQDGLFFGGGLPGSTNQWIKASAVLPNGIEFGGDSPRVYKGANIQTDVVFNKLGYHYPQQRILALWEDVPHLLPTTAADEKRPPEPLVMRMNTFDCAKYLHTNLVPKEFFTDDYQILTPTDVIGQHIHLPKWDLTSADGSANGWNYEDGTFSPGAVRERIHAINAWNEAQATAGQPTVPNPEGTPKLIPKPHPHFGTLAAHQKADCVSLWEASTFEHFEHDLGFPGACDWLGARTTIQRWFSDPMVNRGGVHRGLGTTFTHDHLGPSTHQQLGLYATMLSEPPGSQWRHNENGTLLGTRSDGGPTSWQAIITGPNGAPIDVDGDKLDDSHREFFLQFGDFQHAYVKDVYVGVTKAGKNWHQDASAKPTTETFRKAINPSVRKPANPEFPDIVAYEPTCPGGDKGIRGAVYDWQNKTRPDRPCPEAISADDIGMMVVNYRNEPVAARVYDPEKNGSDSKKGAQADGWRGDLAFAFQTRTDRAIPELNTRLGNTPYPALTGDVLKGDPFTPIMRAYAGDLVRVKVQAGAHEHEHNGSINALTWLQGGSGYGQAPHSGWRNGQNTGLSEQFTFTARLTDYESPSNRNDRLYVLDTEQDGMWSGAWGILRSSNRCKNVTDKRCADRDEKSNPDGLRALPSNPLPTLLSLGQGQVLLNDCPKGAPVRLYKVAAVLANNALGNPLGVTIPNAAGASLNPKGGTLIYNPRDTAIKIEVRDTASGKVLKTQTFGAGPLHDPTAIMFVRAEDLDTKGKLKEKRPVEPLVLRAAAGECVRISLENRLPRQRDRMPDLGGYTTLGGAVIRDPGTPGSSMTSFNNNLIRPSAHVGLHPQLVHYDVQSYDGNTVGTNKRSTVLPGRTHVYQWYAGAIDIVGSAEACKPDSEAVGEKLKQLAVFPNNPTLRPLAEVYDDVAFTQTLYALADGEKHLTSSEPTAQAVTIAKAFVNIAKGCIESPFDDIRKASNLNPEQAAQLFDDTVDEAPKLLSAAAYDRMAVLKRREGCTQALEVPFRDALLQLEVSKDRAAFLAREAARSFTFQVEHVDDDNRFADAFAWRADRYEGPSPTTTSLALLSKVCRYADIEFGASNLTSPDRIKQGQKGAVGAMIIEPEAATWRELSDDWVIDRQNPGPDQTNMRRSRATANVDYTAILAPGKSVRKTMRDLVLVHQKGLNLRYAKGNAVANLAAEKEHAGQVDTAPEDAHDAGHMAVNYAAEPLWFRFGLPPDAPFGKEGFGGVTHAWQAFSNSCCNNGGTAISVTPVSATPDSHQPYTPVMTVPAGMETRIRVVMPTGVGRASVIHVHGHDWARDPYLAERLDTNGFPKGHRPVDWGVASKCIGGNPLQMNLGGQESVTPMAHYDLLLPQAGGKHKVTGDFLWRDQAGFGITSGLWGILRVEASGTDSSAASPIPAMCP